MVFELYNHSVPNGKIVNIMTTLLNKAGTGDDFVSATMRNITSELEDIMNEIAEVSAVFLTNWHKNYVCVCVLSVWCSVCAFV